MRLLFCDTFSQEPPDGSVFGTWSLIEFPVPVVLEQIQVVPRGVCLHEQLRSEGQSGKTTPEKFRIDFFACDEKNQTSSTFENLCALEYNEISSSIAFPKLPFVTTKLLCSGRYNVVTLAIFGAEATDSDAVRLLHQRRNETAKSGPGLLPTPQEGFQKPVDANHVPPFASPPLGPSPQSISNYPPQSFHGPPNKSRPPFGFVGNEQNNYQLGGFEARNFHDRRRDDLQNSSKLSRNGIFDKSGLLPTPNLGNKGDMPQHQNRGRYQYNHYPQHDGEEGYPPHGKDWPRENFAGFSDDAIYTAENKDKKAEIYISKEQEEEEDWEDAEYEEISEEELDEETAANVEAMVAEDLLLPSSMMSYNPFHMETYPLTHFSAPDITAFELTRNKLHVESESNLNDDSTKSPQSKQSSSSSQLKDLIERTLQLCLMRSEDRKTSTALLERITDGSENEFVMNLENIVPLVTEGLPYLDGRSDRDYTFILANWAYFALELDSRIAQIIGLNVRAIKAGLSLVQKMCLTSADVVEHFSSFGLAESLIKVIAAKHIASSIKILAIHALDSLTDWPLQMSEFVYNGDVDGQMSKHDKANDNMQVSGYTALIKLCLQSQTARVAAALNQLVKKVHLHECMHEIHRVVQSLVMEKVPDGYSCVSDAESHDDDEDYSNIEDAEMIVMSTTSPHQSGNEEEEEMHMNASSMEHRALEVNHIDGKSRRRASAADDATNSLSHEVTSEDELVGDGQLENETVVPMDSIFCLSDVALDENELVKVSDCLKEITAAFNSPQETIGQYPVKHFPLSRQHVTAAENDDKCKANMTLYRFSEESGLISSVQALLTLPFASGHTRVFESCYDFLSQLMSTKSGLLHLTSNSDSVLHVVHHLLLSSPHLDVETPGSAGYLGIKLAMHVQAVQSLDRVCSLLDSPSEEEEVEEEMVHHFKTLFSLTYPRFGKKFLCEILEKDSFFNPILSCLWFPAKFSDPDPEVEKDLKADEDEEEQKLSNPEERSDDEASEDKKEKKPGAVQHKSAINGYASSLLCFMLESLDDVSFVYRHMADLTRACLSELHILSRSEQFNKFFGPLNLQLKCDNSDIPKLVGFVKDKAALLEWSSLTIDGPGITVALRMLCHLCVTDKDGDKGTDAESRLRVLELFSADSLNTLLTLGDHLHKSLHYFCHGIRPMATGLTSSTHALIVAMCRCIFSLLRLLLFHVLDASIDRKNINSIQIARTVVSLYSDLYILLRPADTTLLHGFTGKAIEVLSLFFVDASPAADERHPVVSEMIKQAESRCDNFMPTLLLLSQLLPMPLPLIALEDPPASARATALALCKLWSTVLSPHVDDLLAFLLPLSSSISRPVLDVVIIFMQQIIDLSPSLALIVVKKYIDDTSPLLVNTVLANINDDVEAKEEADVEQKELLMLSPEQITAIVTFSEILTLPTAKAAAIAALSSEGEGVMDLWTYAARSQTPAEDVAATLLLASVLVDTSLSLSPLQSDRQSLSNAFPPTAHFKAILDLAVQKIDSSSPVVAGRVYLVLAHLQKNEIAIPYIRKALKSESRPLYCGLKKLADAFDSVNLSWLDVLGNFLEFLNLLTDPSLDSGSKKKKELTLSLNISQLKTLLRWSSDVEHPLRLVHANLKSMLLEEELNLDGEIDPVLDQLSCLVQSLNAVRGKEKIPSLDREELPAPTPLSEQFADRPVHVLGLEDWNMHVRLSITAPFPTVGSSAATDDKRMAQCDLITTADEFCPGYGLAEELNKLAKAVDVQHVAEETEAMEKRRQKIETYSARLGKSLTYMKRSHGLLMTQQRVTRGRGRGNPSNRPFDLFRHRKQNTSRPPSMHVDDFVAADEEQLNMEGEEPNFKTPPPPPLSTVTVRRPMNQTFKTREFPPRGGGRGRVSRNNYFRGRGSYQGNSNAITPANKFRPRPSSTGNRGGRVQDRFRTSSSSARMSGRLSFSPNEGFKTNKQEQGSWSGAGRDYPGSYRGRGTRAAKPSRGNFFPSPHSKWGVSSFQRRGRVYNKPRGKHIRSSTR